MSQGVRRLLRIGRNTADLERAIAFHRDALGFRVCGVSTQPPAWTRLPGIGVEPSRCALLSLGAQQIELTEFRDGAPYPRESSACDPWFQHCAIVVGDMAAAFAEVMRHGAAPITHGGPQTLPPATGSVEAFKFRDPDGHPLELIRFPRGVGDPAWQDPQATQATLGIDHSAISVGDVARSIAFNERLGLHVAARGVNRGVAQQRLDGLVDDVVDVVALHAAVHTPHLELLGYRSPRGRPGFAARADARVSDRLVWQVGDVGAMLRKLRTAGGTGSVVAGEDSRGAGVALLRDPDGHLVVLEDAGAAGNP